MEAPITMDNLFKYAELLSSGKTLMVRSPDEFPDDIAELLRNLKSPEDLDQDRRDALQFAYAQWEEDDWMVDREDWPDPDENPDEGPPRLDSILDKIRRSNAGERGIFLDVSQYPEDLGQEVAGAVDATGLTPDAEKQITEAYRRWEKRMFALD